MKRRKFILKAGMGAAGVGLGATGMGLNAAGLGPDTIPFTQGRTTAGSKKDELFIGTPVLPEYLFEKGIAETLDAMQELAGIKTVMTFSHSHVFRQYNKDFAPKTDAEGHPLTDLFIKPGQQYYRNKHMMGLSEGLKYSGRDVLNELYPEARKRRMEIYARILEPYRITGAIPGFEAFAEIDAGGEKGADVCFNHPGYIAYWEDVINDLVRSHPFLHGFKYGQERAGPLHQALNGHVGTCFCEHCMKLAKKRQIDMDNARKGIFALRDYSRRIGEGETPHDGKFVLFFRILSKYPHLLSMERLWMDSREQQRVRMYRQIKKINPFIQVGWHIDHGMTWDPFTRAIDEYSRKGRYSDWLSIAVYFDSMGRRSMNHYNKRYRNMLFGDADPDHTYPMYLSILGYDPENQPPLKAHEQHDTAFSSDYVYSECLRAVKNVNGGAKVYARPGFDMPGYECNVQPEDVHAATTAALRAGVDGLWCGREWDEIKPGNAAAFGKAIKDWKE